MRYREKLNIIIMRDNGPRRSFHMKRSNFILLFIFFACLPFVVILLSTQCWIFWQENTRLKEAFERFEADYQAAEARAEQLENLEELLREENISAREVLLRQLASIPEKNKPEPSQASLQELSEQAEGPGHEDFPSLDTGRVLVDNVQVRAMRRNALRIGLDLRNPDNQPLLSGEVEATLLTADGDRIHLPFSPAEVGNFRISKFKRTVINAQVGRGVNLENAQVTIEVKDQEGKPIYRNVYAVQQ